MTRPRGRRKRVGQRPLGAARTSPRIQIGVDPKLASALKAARVRTEKRPVSDVARTALREYVTRQTSEHQRRSPLQPGSSTSRLEQREKCVARSERHTLRGSPVARMMQRCIEPILSVWPIFASRGMA